MLNFSCLRTRAVVECGWQELELNPLSLCDEMVKLPLGRGSSMSATPSIPTFTSLPGDCCSPSSVQLWSTSSLSRATGRERVLSAGTLQSVVPCATQAGTGSRHFHCCKTDLKFRANLCTHLSKSRGNLEQASDLQRKSSALIFWVGFVFCVPANFNDDYEQCVKCIV